MAYKDFKAGDSLTEEEFKELSTNKPDKELLKKLGVSSMEEFVQERDSIFKSAANTETYFQRLEKKIKRGQVTEDTLNSLNVARDLFKLGTSMGQINKSDKALSKLKRPSLPQLPKYDAGLDYEINRAQQGTMDAAKVVEPARQAIDRGFTADLTSARGAVGGQSGAYGALAQTAALRRNRAYGELSPMIDNVRAREQSRVDNLLSRRMQERQQNFDNRSQLYNFDNANYQNDVNAASDLGLAGRENLAGTFDSLPSSLAAFAGTQYGRRNSIRPEDTTMVPEIDEFRRNQIENNMLYNPMMFERPSQLPRKLAKPMYYNQAYNR